MFSKKFFFPALIIAFLSCAIFSCGDKETKCKAGLGGNLTIVGYPHHHDSIIYSKSSYPDTVFLKFNATEFPGDGANYYDTYFVGAIGADSVVMSGLKCGSYYIFGTGYDTNLHKRVKGGFPYSTEQTDGTIRFNVPITEE